MKHFYSSPPKNAKNKGLTFPTYPETCHAIGGSHLNSRLEATIPTYSTNLRKQGRPKGTSRPHVPQVSGKPENSGFLTLPRVLRHVMRLADNSMLRAEEAQKRGDYTKYERHAGLVIACARTLAPFIASRLHAVNPADSNAAQAARPMALVAPVLSADEWSRTHGHAPAENVSDSSTIANAMRQDATPMRHVAASVQAQAAPPREVPRPSAVKGEQKPPQGTPL